MWSLSSCRRDRPAGCVVPARWHTRQQEADDGQQGRNRGGYDSGQTRPAPTLAGVVVAFGRCKAAQRAVRRPLNAAE